MYLLQNLSLAAVLFQFNLSVFGLNYFSKWIVDKINDIRIKENLPAISYSEELSKNTKLDIYLTKRLEKCKGRSCELSVRWAVENDRLKIISIPSDNCYKAAQSLFVEKQNLDVIFNKLRWTIPWESVGAYCQKRRAILTFKKHSESKHITKKRSTVYHEKTSSQRFQGVSGQTSKVKKEKKTPESYTNQNYQSSELGFRSNGLTLTDSNYFQERDFKQVTPHLTNSEIKSRLSKLPSLEPKKIYRKIKTYAKVKHYMSPTSNNKGSRQMTIYNYANFYGKAFTVPNRYPKVISFFYDKVNFERIKNDKVPIPFSPELTKVAQAKSDNMEEFYWEPFTKNKGIHDWNGKYACQYVASNFACMNDIPYLLSDYKGKGFEISFASEGYTNDDIFDGWMNSEGHRNVILSSGPKYNRTTWLAMGVGRSKRMTNIWFGYEEDPHYPRIY